MKDKNHNYGNKSDDISKLIAKIKKTVFERNPSLSEMIRDIRIMKFCVN